MICDALGVSPGAFVSTNSAPPLSITSQSGAPERPCHMTFRISPPALMTHCRNAADTRPSGVVVIIVLLALEKAAIAVIRYAVHLKI
jgi:hypothetical protein